MHERLILILSKATTDLTSTTTTTSTTTQTTTTVAQTTTTPVPTPPCNCCEFFTDASRLENCCTRKKERFGSDCYCCGAYATVFPFTGTTTTTPSTSTSTTTAITTTTTTICELNIIMQTTSSEYHLLLFSLLKHYINML